jgi:hypothetical protein
MEYWTLEDETDRFPETSITSYQSTMRKNRQERRSHLHRGRKKKSRSEKMKITRYFETSDCALPATQRHDPVGLKPQDEFYVSNENVKGRKVIQEKVVPVHDMEADAGMMV